MKGKLLFASLVIFLIVFVSNSILMSALANAYEPLILSSVESASPGYIVTEEYGLWSCYSRVNYVNVITAWVLLILLVLAFAITLKRCAVYSAARRQSLKFSSSQSLYEALLDNRPGEAMRICAEYARSHRARIVSAGLQAWQPARGAEKLSVERSRRAMQNAAERRIEEFNRGLWMLKAIMWTAPFAALCAVLLNLVDTLECIQEAEGFLVAVIASDLVTFVEIIFFGLVVARLVFLMYLFLQSRVERLASDMEDSSWMVIDHCLKWQINQATIASSYETTSLEADNSQVEGRKPLALWLYAR